MNSGRDVGANFVVLILAAARPERDDLRFGEHHALAAHLSRLFGLKRNLPELIQREPERNGRLLQKPTGTGRALVVHDEFDHLAGGRIDLDGFRILPANVDNRACGGVQDVRSHRVAGDLRHHLVRNVTVGERDPAVARTHDVGRRGALDARGAQQFAQNLVGRFLHVQPGGDLYRIDGVGREQNAFGAPGADDEARTVVNELRIDFDCVHRSCRLPFLI